MKGMNFNKFKIKLVLISTIKIVHNNKTAYPTNIASLLLNINVVAIIKTIDNNNTSKNFSTNKKEIELLIFKLYNFFKYIILLTSPNLAGKIIFKRDERIVASNEAIKLHLFCER